MTGRVSADRVLASSALVVAVVAISRLGELPLRLGSAGDWSFDGPAAFYFLCAAAAAIAGALLAWAPGIGAGAGKGLALAALAAVAWGAAASTLDLGVAAVLWSAGWILAACAVGQGGGPERLEAAVKTQGLGAAAGLALLLAAALLVGLAGSTHLLEAGVLIGARADSSVLALSSVRVLLAGLALAGAWAPFHYWAPDGLGSSTRPAALVLAVCAPLAATLALSRTLFAFEPSLGALAVHWRGGLFAVAFLTVAVAGSVALVQQDAARLTAYLTVAQSAELLAALCAPPGDGRAWIAAAEAHLVALVPLWLALGAWSASGRPTSFAALAGRGRAHPWSAALWIAALLFAAGFPGGARFLLRPELARASGEPVTWTLFFLLAALLPCAASARLARVLFLEGAAGEAPLAGPARPAVWAWSLCGLALVAQAWLAWGGPRAWDAVWGLLLPGG